MGAAIFVYGGAFTIDDSHLSQNSATAGASGGGFFTAGPGASAAGAAASNYSGDMQIRRTSFASNTATGGSTLLTTYSRFGANGGIAMGGGVACLGGTTTLTNATVSGNMAVGGDASWGSLNTSVTGGTGEGGGLIANAGSLSLTNCTIVGNRAQPGLAFDTATGGGMPGRAGNNVFGGGIYVTSGSPSMRNNLLSGNLQSVIIRYPDGTIFSTTNTASDAYGTFGSLGHNLLTTNAGATGFVASDLVNVAAPLGPLQDNGGPTPTHALVAGSPAFNAGDNSGAPATDQRGVARPQDGTVEIGAYEVASLEILIDGRPALPGAFVRNTPATVGFQTTFPAGAILYTLDGSTPGLSSTLYTQPFTLSNSAIVRAVAYTSNFSSSILGGPWQFTISAPRTLTVTKTGQGTVTTTPPNTGPYPQGTVVTLTATPDVGWVFQGWSGDLTGSASPATLTMTLDRAVRATFVPLPLYTLTITKSGAGTVTHTPGGSSYFANTVVALSTAPAQGWVFTGWSGDASGTVNPLSVTMDASKSVQANFTALFSLNVATAGGGGVSLSPPAGPYLAGTVVNATATAASGWQFLRWLGDLENSSATASVTMSRHKSIEAVFGTALTVNIVGSGTVNRNPNFALHAAGSVVRLTAMPASGSYFSFWSNPINSAATPTDLAIVDANPVVFAFFSTLDVNESSFTVLVDGGGTVSSAPFANRFVNGSTVQLLARPGTGQTFLGWSGNASGASNPLGVTVNAATVITAQFTKLPTLTVTADPGLIEAEGARLVMRGEAGSVYRVFAAETLTGAWVFIGAVTNDFGMVQFLDGGALRLSERFYRVEMP